MAKEVILTGLRANAEFHLGNYLGGILPMVQQQKKHAGKYQLNMFIPDLHSFTTPIDHGKLYEQTHQNLKVFVAAGLDIDQPDTFIYRQSYIPAHSELTWILDCFTGFGEMSRMTEFKDKAAKLRGSQMIEEVWKEEDVPGSSDRISVGLFNYPVLMAADILLYGAKWVPVGEDQRQHVEFAREIANRLNNRFKDLFVMPADNVEQIKFAGRAEPVRIRSLRNPERKMSKSVEDPAGTIMLSDQPEDAANKITEATTDSQGTIHYDWEKQPGITNLLQILALLSGEEQEKINEEWTGKTSYGVLKNTTAGAVKDFLVDFQQKLVRLDEEALIKRLVADEMTKN